MFVIDSQGTMLKNIQSLGSLGEFTPVYYGPDNVRLNLFQTIDADLFLYLFSAIDADLTSKQAGALHYLLRLMQQLPQPSIQTLLDVVEAPKGKYDEPVSKLDTFAQSFFDRHFYGPDMKATHQQLARRLYQLLADPLFAKIFGGNEKAPATAVALPTDPNSITHFDAYSLMQSGSVVLLDTSEAKLGVQASAVLGRFYIAQILAAAYRMGEQRTLRNFLIVDECAHLHRRTHRNDFVKGEKIWPRFHLGYTIPRPTTTHCQISNLRQYLN